MGHQALGLAIAGVIAVVVAFVLYKRKTGGAVPGPAGPVGPSAAWVGQPSTATESWWTKASPPDGTFSYPCPPGVTSSDTSPHYCIIPADSAQEVCAKDPACTGYLTLPSGTWATAEWLEGGSNPQGVLLNESPTSKGTYQGTYYAKPAQ
jgi:hypothetical protein